MPTEPELPAELVWRVAEIADENSKILDGTTGPIKAIIDASELCFAVWRDPKEYHGVGLLIVKGGHILWRIASGEQSAENVKLGAFPASDFEQALAAKEKLGEPYVNFETGDDGTKH